MNRMLVYAVITACVMSGIECLNFLLFARIALPILSVILMGLALWFRWERTLLVQSVSWVHAALAWLTAVLFGSLWIGLGAGFILEIGFGIYLAISGYIAERTVCDLRCHRVWLRVPVLPSASGAQRSRKRIAFADGGQLVVRISQPQSRAED